MASCKWRMAGEYGFYWGVVRGRAGVWRAGNMAWLSAKTIVFNHGRGPGLCRARTSTVRICDGAIRDRVAVLLCMGLFLRFYYYPSPRSFDASDDRFKMARGLDR